MKNDCNMMIFENMRNDIIERYIENKKDGEMSCLLRIFFDDMFDFYGILVVDECDS